ncbi:MAG TPA: TetR/AcrR family transcriptional regulator [Nevskiaceae bacterium]|nr:TetR/AcrR family transcriptional regulator [Nevskiaceae bacterium]
MGRRNQHGREEQRDMAIAAAELILVKGGYAALSMRKVADAIGYTVGNLYLLFKNQDELLDTINGRTADAIYARLSEAASAAGTQPLARVRAIAAGYIAYAQQHPHRFRLLFEHQGSTPRTPADADTRVQMFFDLVESSIAPLLPRVRPERLRMAAATLWSGVHGICMLAVTGKLRWSGIEEFRPLSDMLVGTFLAGLGSSPAPRPPPAKKKK